MPRAAPSPRGSPLPKPWPLNREDIDGLFQTRHRIPSLRRRIFVADISREVQVRDRLCDEAVIQFLRLIDFMPSRIPARVEVADPLNVIAGVAHYITIHELRG